ncbi:MAG: hypothetical protein HXY44_13180 [Syntrophaceae bacterium]|nr:hypothetical protein [Syntrophaceae bacterium]
MSGDKRKGFFAGYRKAGPTLRFTIKVGVIAIVLAVALFAIQMYFGPTKTMQHEAKIDRKVKHEEILDSQAHQHEEILDSQAHQTGILSRIETGIEDLRKTIRVVQSSAVTVQLNFRVSEKTPRSFNGTIANTTETCIVETKSGNKLNYVSTPGSTRMIRGQETYEFLFKAELPPEVSEIRSAPEEFLGAKGISIPIRGFLEIMKKNMSSKGICTLEQIEIGYHVNGTLITKQVEDVGVEVIEGKADVINFAINASYIPLDRIRR